jgi:hypothetical protein
MKEYTLNRQEYELIGQIRNGLKDLNQNLEHLIPHSSWP